MFDDGVLGLSQDAAKGASVEGLEVGQDGHAADDFGYEAEGLEVLGGYVLEHVVFVELVGLAGGGEADDVGIEPLGYLAFDAVEGAAADEEDVFGVDGDEVLAGVFASAFWGDVDYRAFEELEQALLDAFAAYVAGDGGVVAFAGYLVDFVDEDDAALGGFYVVVGDLEESGQDAFYVFAYVAGFGEDGGVDDGEGDVELFGDGAGQEGFAGSCAAYHYDVGFFYFYAVVVFFLE